MGRPRDPVFARADGTALYWDGKLQQRLRVLSGVEDWHLHDFRTAAVSLPSEAFVSYSEEAGDLWLGHKRNGAVMAKYQRATRLDALRTVARQWDTVLRRAIGAELADNVVAL